LTRADSEGRKNEVTKLKEKKISVITENPNYHCEEEPEVGERVPPSLQRDVLPLPPLLRAGVARKSRTPRI
jgi:hypothetical protein